MCESMCVRRECPGRIKATETGFHIKDERRTVVPVFSHVGSDSDLSLYLKKHKNFEQTPNIFLIVVFLGFFLNAWMFFLCLLIAICIHIQYVCLSLILNSDET